MQMPTEEWLATAGSDIRIGCPESSGSKAETSRVKARNVFRPEKIWHQDKNISIGTDAYYEEQASQDEIYLEETEEKLRMILESDDPSPLRSESPDQQREHAAEELIIGDSDDPPLSEEMVKQILRVTIIFRDLD
jgi:hypothetical protein